MTIQECYDAFGGSYQDVKQRLQSDALVERFVKKFLDDKSYEMLCGAIEAGDCETAFRAAHTLKGVSQNLSFQRLAKSSSEMTECLRGKEDFGSDGLALGELLANVKKDYEAVIEAIQKLG